ncbi:A-kinase anchor protein inhibitor 1 isoform X2 [Anolis sagrei]|uniref:A-kinase anchor protein inhibitor 1 isoform X2 n=1 Tax=Anolis sagrei TaxID=38937 RepID=UPI00295AD59D|nr:A-kinase anchor protein inhibitor 1 isoform X2 [Anolis sagrei ordinatus]
MPALLSLRPPLSAFDARSLFLGEEATMVFAPGEQSGNNHEEARLQHASKQIVHTAIQQAVQQFSQESQRKEKCTNSSVNLQLEQGQLTKKHEKK